MEIHKQCGKAVRKDTSECDAWLAGASDCKNNDENEKEQKYTYFINTLFMYITHLSLTSAEAPKIRKDSRGSDTKTSW